MPEPVLAPIIQSDEHEIRWGTKGILKGQSGDTLGKAICESVSFKPKTDLIEVEDGDGFSRILALLDNGGDIEVKCVWDTPTEGGAVEEWPGVGDVVQLAMPRKGSIMTMVTAISDDHQRKKEGMITLTLAYRPGVTLAFPA